MTWPEDGGSLDSWTLNITTITCETAALLARGSGFADAQASDGRAIESLTCAGFRPSANGVVSPAGEPADGDVEDDAVIAGADLGPPYSTRSR